MDKPAKKPLDRDPYRLGNSFVFPPHVIDDIHIKSELGRYRMRGMSLFKKIPRWDDLTFMPGTLTRFVIEGYREKCVTRTIIGPRAGRPLDLDIPIYVTGMSFGALSYEAKTALARSATMAGTATCSGEGGMIPDERRYSTKWFYQCIQSRYGFNPHHLVLADGCEFFIGQGCKVGLGGHLMGQKVTDQIAEMRSLPAGIDQRSPARHPDWLGPDEAAERVYNFLHTLTIEAQMFARACGKTNIHSLEPEDLAALTMEASAMAAVPLAGTNYTVGVEDYHHL